jgi:hypothetical protein
MPNPSTIAMEDELLAEATEGPVIDPPRGGAPRPPRRSGGVSYRGSSQMLAVVPREAAKQVERQAFGPFTSQAAAEAAQSRAPGDPGDWLIVPLLPSP